jgi:hypothetical protein
MNKHGSSRVAGLPHNLLETARKQAMDPAEWTRSSLIQSVDGTCQGDGSGLADHIDHTIGTWSLYTCGRSRVLSLDYVLEQLRTLVVCVFF